MPEQLASNGIADRCRVVHHPREQVVQHGATRERRGALLGDPVVEHAQPLDGLPALELAGTIVTVLLVLLTIALRQGFLIDLALVLAALQLVGALVYVRALERGV